MEHTTFTFFKDICTVLEALEYGRLDNVEITVDVSEEELQRAAQSTKVPLRNFARHLVDEGGHSTFMTLKVQNGLPVYGEKRFSYAGKAGVKSYKFS